MKTIIEMAREANAMHNIIEEWVTFDYAELERFAELVRAEAQAEEREACAKVCDAWDEWAGTQGILAKAIRARGNT